MLFCNNKDLFINYSALFLFTQFFVGFFLAMFRTLISPCKPTLLESVINISILRLCIDVAPNYSVT